jgi:hypothetical protein
VRSYYTAFHDSKSLTRSELLVFIKKEVMEIGRHGHVFLFIDGFSEASPTLQQELVDTIHDLQTSCPSHVNVLLFARIDGDVPAYVVDCDDCKQPTAIYHRCRHADCERKDGFGICNSCFGQGLGSRRHGHHRDSLKLARETAPCEFCHMRGLTQYRCQHFDCAPRPSFDVCEGCLAKESGAFHQAHRSSLEPVQAVTWCIPERHAEMHAFVTRKVEDLIRRSDG